jgi:hypothetical protein
MKTMIVEPRIAKRLGLGASFGVLALASVAYGTQAARGADGLFDQASAFGMSALPGIIAMGAMASLVSSGSRRQGALALAVGTGALAVQTWNGASYWESKDAHVMSSKAGLANAEQALRVHQVTPSDPIRAQVEGLVEEGGPKERRAIREQRRQLRAEVAKAEATEIAHTGLKVRVQEAAADVAAATANAQPFVWARSFVLTAIEALGPAACALSAKGRLQPQPQPQPAPKPVNPASNLAHMGWSGERGQKRREALRKAKPLNEAAI